MTAASTNIAAAFALGWLAGKPTARADDVKQIIGEDSAYNILSKLSPDSFIRELCWDMTEDELEEISSYNAMFSFADMKAAREEILRQAEKHSGFFADSWTEEDERGHTITIMGPKPDIPDTVPAELAE